MQSMDSSSSTSVRYCSTARGTTGPVVQICTELIIIEQAAGIALTSLPSHLCFGDFYGDVLHFQVKVCFWSLQLHFSTRVDADFSCGKYGLEN